MGGARADTALDVALDAAGNVYVVGQSGSAGWITRGPDSIHKGTDDGFVAKISATGALLWSRYLGGSGFDSVDAVTVDSAGTIYVVGSTYCAGLAFGGYDTTYGGGTDDAASCSDGFAARIDTNGILVWATYVGGADWDMASDVALDSSGDIYVTGTTASAGWISGGSDNTLSGYIDGFLLKLNPTGQRVWSSYVGGRGTDRGNALALHPDGSVYVVGETDLETSWNLYVPGALPEWASGGFNSRYTGAEDGYLAGFGPGGQRKSAYYIGGEGGDEVLDITINAAGRIYVAGNTFSSHWLSGGLGDEAFGTSEDGFAAEVKSDGTMVWSTYLGANGYDWASGIVADITGAVYVHGTASSEGWANGALYENDTDYLSHPYLAKITTAEEVQIIGTDGADQIELKGEGENYVLTVNGAVTRYSGNTTTSFIIRAGLGDDVIKVGPEVTLRVAIYGREGNDTITGGGGQTSLYGGTGDDLLVGGMSNDVLEGGEGRDTLRGMAGLDMLYGHAGNDMMIGGGGDDELYGNGDDDTLLGGLGDDFLTGNSGHNYVYGGLDEDTLRTSEGIDYAIGGPELTNTAIRDDAPVGQFVGKLMASDDLTARFTYALVAGSGDSDNGSFQIIGDGVYTAAVLDHETTPTCSIRVRATRSDGWMIESSIALQVVDPPAVAEVTGTAGDDVIRVSMLADQLVYVVNGVEASTPWNSSEGLLIFGLGGNDLIEVAENVTAREVVIYGGDGNDTIRGTAGKDSIYGNFGNDVIYGRAGNDTVMGGMGTDRLEGEGGDDHLLGGNQSDTIYGGVGQDCIEGKGKADTLYGGEGNDWIRGQAGSDLMYGDAGDDVIEAYDDNMVFADIVYGGIGVDSVSWDVLDWVSEQESDLGG